MRPPARFLAVLFAVAAAALPARDALAAPSLDDTYWESDDDCFIVDLAFYSDGSVDIDYDNGEDDTGTWRLEGNAVTVEFDTFGDTFIGNVNGETLKAAHIWFEMETEAPMTESCVFRRMNAPSNGGAGSI